MSAIQQTVYKFFTDAQVANSGPRSTLNISILVWQAALGYISPSITQNWMAIAQDNDIQYLGDLDMQNGIATGKYTVV